MSPASSDADFPPDLRALEREYELIRELGQGGMAAVYLARRRSTGRLVAIKAIRARYLDDPDALQRFTREAPTVAGLDHPNIVRTESIEQIDDRAVAIIMEHVPGGTVRDWLREHGSLGAEHAESILRDVASALAYAHRHGIVHRDVKPENVFLDTDRGRALLSDFGIARRIDGDGGITLLGAALGTPQYMSPEQIDGQLVDGRSDITASACWDGSCSPAAGHGRAKACTASSTSRSTRTCRASRRSGRAYRRTSCSRSSARS